MPIYEYQCSNCGMKKDFLRKISDAPLTTCPECGKETLKKMLTAAGFQLKGTGWYATDFKDGGKSATTTSTAPSEAKTDAKPEAKTETKSESAAPAACGGSCACH